MQTFQVFEWSFFPGKREAKCVRELLPTYFSTAPMVKPGGRVVGRSLSEWTTRSTLWGTSRKHSCIRAPLYLQLCDREKQHQPPHKSLRAAFAGLEDEDGLLPAVDSWKCKASPQRLVHVCVDVKLVLYVDRVTLTHSSPERSPALWWTGSSLQSGKNKKKIKIPTVSFLKCNCVRSQMWTYFG